ncbi:hypothetical protein [Methyloversatilis thermotolerans]|uniref:hypothetical protein n=1 Tax=Methyloversatilis thermotolerans TaxID=1346290 RepID=UPI00035F2EC0|nr:hypothetical protein [Methyloversatilis thermotolerans]
MPRFKTPDYGLKLISVDFAQQVLPGTFEFALCHLVDNDLDLSVLRARYATDAIRVRRAAAEADLRRRR